MSIRTRPAEGEFSPYYAGYIAGVPDGDLLDTLAAQRDALLALLEDVPEEDGDRRYAPGKWSIREVLGHVIDTERIMAYRALRVARDDATPLPGFDQDHYVAVAGFGARSLRDLLAEMRVVRGSSIALLRPMGEAELDRRTEANGVPVTARALAWIIAGHERHHTRILRERYLSPGDGGGDGRG